ncbi:MAG TPA: ribbon-helix-helix domain-containing protein [Thermomicrobiaceae bacterium]|nr:ribbon-helix-helix domain-containing protein [Thermomicrobiaceae bacterium]
MAEPTETKVWIHIVMPKVVVAEIDRLVGTRHRSEFVTDAVEEKLRRERLKKVAHEFAGSLANGGIPEWDTAESAAEWVRSLRREADRSVGEPDSQ